MRKGLGLNGHSAGVFLLSVAMLQGCSNNAKLRGRGNVTNQQGGLVANICNPPEAKLSVGVSASIYRHFSELDKKLEALSEQETDLHFVDRDIKGRELVFRGEATHPDDPTVEPWAHKDPDSGVPGTATDRAYAELKLRTDGEPVIVAVLDTGLDINHEALKDNIAAEGWNFLGGKNGNVYHTTLEVTRELKRMRELDKVSSLGPKQKEYLAQLEKDYAEGKAKAEKNLELRKEERDQFSLAISVLKTHCNIKDGSLAELKQQVSDIQTETGSIRAAKKLALKFLSKDWSFKRFDDSIAKLTASIEIGKNYYYNMNFDSSTIVGDDPNKLDDQYGNDNVLPQVEDEAHATHVAGIIGAVRGKNSQLVGQAFNVRLMPLRAVPDGDERDKDVGNAIRFAADHGARVVNMSFGKHYSSPEGREYVWKAIEYAAARNVLLVHAAGNDSLNNDETSHYPDREVRDQDRNLLRTLPNVIEVGASSSTLKDQVKDENGKEKEVAANFAAEFSDYGQRTVDLFAPGVKIYSSIPGNHYAEFKGTSMAAPEVAGIAALLLSQRPDLSVTDLKKILLDTVTPYKGLEVIKPGSTDLVDFGQLSITGGVVNAYRALKAVL